MKLLDDLQAKAFERLPERRREHLRDAHALLTSDLDQPDAKLRCDRALVIGEASRPVLGELAAIGVDRVARRLADRRSKRLRPPFHLDRDDVGAPRKSTP